MEEQTIEYKKFKTKDYSRKYNRLIISLIRYTAMNMIIPTNTYYLLNMN